MSGSHDQIVIYPSTKYSFLLNGKLKTLISTNEAEYVSGETAGTEKPECWRSLFFNAM